MTHRKTTTTLIRIISWTAVGMLVAVSVLFYYCYVLFTEDLAVLMTQTPKSKPSIIYSDVFLVKEGAIYDNLFLTERLKNLGVSFNEGPNQLEWKGRDFDFPSAIQPEPKTLAGPDETVNITIQDGRVSSIAIGEKNTEAVAIEPTPVATLASSSRTIRNYVKLGDIPVHLRFAIMAVEDQRFLEHHGFDLRSLARAILANLKSHALRQGGSTITQQLVKNLLSSPQKTLFRKVRELVLAIMVERTFSKDEILEKYMNEVYFGQAGSLELHGVSEAASHFFDKPLSKLSLAESALLAGIIRGPSVYSPYKHLHAAVERKNSVLRKMADQGLISKDELTEALSQKITLAQESIVNNRAPYFVDFVKSEVLEAGHDKSWGGDLSSEGLRIFTTIDLALQRRADQAVATTVRELETHHRITRPLRLEGILVAADPQTGFIKAIVGGRSYGETTFNRVLNMERQVGSTFKPIVYLTALLHGADASGTPYTGAYMIDDSPWTYSFGNKSWTPRNYEKGFRGRITLHEAFVNSINIPMAKIGVDVGIDKVIDTAHRLGISKPLPNVPSLVLGSVDLSPIQLLQAYSTLANRGERVELSTVRAIVRDNGEPLARFETRRDQQIEPRYVDVLNDLLSGVVGEGTAKSMPRFGYAKPARGKTGTTSFSRDAWFAGFSQDLVAVAWTGFDELKTPDSPDSNDSARKFKSPALLTGAGAALPTWARFFAAVKPSVLVDPDPQSDSALERVSIDRMSGLRARSGCPSDTVFEQVFVPNTAPSTECNLH